EMPPVVNDTFDLRDPTMAEGIAGAFRAMFAPEGSVLRVLGPASMDDAFLDITIDETPLTAAMWRFTRNFASVVMTIPALVGLAVAKINHDLRNMLTAAQLISDRLATIPDPLAVRLAPRLVATLDRAIAFCQETLTYGAAVENAPMRRRVALREVIQQAVEAS